VITKDGSSHSPGKEQEISKQVPHKIAGEQKIVSECTEQKQAKREEEKLIVRLLMGFPLIESSYQEEEKEEYRDNYPRVGHENQVYTYHDGRSPTPYLSNVTSTYILFSRLKRRPITTLQHRRIGHHAPC
jgi:hypothetical protein